MAILHAATEQHEHRGVELRTQMLSQIGMFARLDVHDLACGSFASFSRKKVAH